MTELLTMEKLVPGGTCPVMAAKIPPQIMKELDVWVKESKQLKNSPLAALKAHENIGYLYPNGDGKKHNSYQCSISPHLVDSSFWICLGISKIRTGHPSESLLDSKGLDGEFSMRRPLQ